MSEIKQINIASEMKKSFLEYAMSVIVSRALPDVRDGLKPVHRRIIYSMNELGMHSDKSYKKSARIVGEVMGKYHPHGDSSIYDAMVRLAQDFSTRYMLIQGHGNFGSIDGDSPAAMRYTEARMSKISMYMVKDIKKKTIDFQDNYDATETEPVVLPSRFPNVLVNGTTGIAVGMATNIAPHNLEEVIDGLIAYMENDDITTRELMEYIKGPDFPTGGVILGTSGIYSAFETGKGSIPLRCKSEIIDIRSGKQAIIITEIPYQVQKERLVVKIADLVKEKKIDGITDLRDESNRDGIRIVIELRKDVNSGVILNNLYKQTQMQTNFSINNLALVNNEPKLLTLKETLGHYLNHQVEVIERRTLFDLNKAKERLHIVEGLLIALDNIDKVIEIIRASKTDEEIIEKFDREFSLSEIQSKAILSMQLRRLSGLEREKIGNEADELRVLIEELEFILSSKEKIYEIIREELEEIREKFGDERRTEIDNTAIDYIDDESLIPVEDIMLMLSSEGYIKRTKSSDYRVQNRGGVGLKGMKTNEEDFVDIVLNSSTHDFVLFFTNFGKVYRLKGYEIPEYSRTAKGVPIINLLLLDPGEKVNSIITIPEFNEDCYLCFATKKGLIKRTSLSEYESIRKTGKIAISLREEDELISVRHTSGSDSILLCSSSGKSVLFKENSIRSSGRNSSGVRGIRISETEVCIGMAVADNASQVLVISENGYGKRTPIDKYRHQTRGGSGVKTIKITEKNGPLVAARAVKGDEDIMVSSNEGMMIRTSVEQVSITGRDTLGVRIINLKEGEVVSNIAIVSKEDEVVLETSEELN
ncbi:MAG: DNA gyrase subunit A [Bacilli bacterium]